MPGHAIDFTPYPSVNPQGAPSGDFERIEANPNMFGGAIARSEEQLGQSVEKASSETGQTFANIAEFAGRVNVDDQINHWITRKDNILRGDPNKTSPGPDGQPQPDRGYLGLEGRSASDLRADTLKALEDSRLEGRNNLASPIEKLAYDQQTRRMYSIAENDISAHANSQWKNWAVGVQAANAHHEINDYVNNIGDPAAMKSAAENYVTFQLQQAKLKFGDDPKIMEEAEAGAKLDLLKAHVDAVAVKDPARAMEILESNKRTAGTKYDDMYAKLRNRADEQTANERTTAIIQRAKGGAFSQPVHDAISNAAARYGIDPVTLQRAAQIESGGNPHAVTRSYKGLFQLSTSEFQRYAPPGGNIWDPADNAAAAAAKMKAEGDQFARNFGRQPTGFDSYMIHQQGLAGYSTHLANPDAAAWQNMLATGEGRQKGERWAKQAIWGNIPDQYKASYGNVNNVTSRDFIAMWAAKFGSSQPEFLPTAGINVTSPLATAPTLRPSTSTRSVPWQFPIEDTALGQGRGAYETAAFPVPNIAATIKPSVIQQVLDDPVAQANPSVMTKMLHDAQQRLSAEEIAENQSTKARKEIAEGAADEYTQAISVMRHTPHPDFVALAGRVTADPRLNYETRKAILDRITHQSGEEEALSFGAGYLSARQNLFSPPGTPSHINDFSELVQDPDITTKGLEDLRKRMALVKADVDHAATERRINSFLAGAKKELSFEQDNGFIKIRDPKGELIYNYQFVPDFVKRASELTAEAQRTGDHSKLDKFLSVENVRKMVREYRNPQEMAADKLRATGESVGTPEAANAPLPPVPEGITPANWRAAHDLVPVSGATGQRVTHAQWGQVLELLNDNPSPQMMAAFDRAYAPSGLTAKNVLKILNPAAAIAAEKTGNIGVEPPPSTTTKPWPVAPAAPNPSVSRPGLDHNAHSEWRNAAVAAAAPLPDEGAHTTQSRMEVLQRQAEENELARAEGRAPRSIPFETPEQAQRRETRQRTEADETARTMREGFGAITKAEPEVHRRMIEGERKGIEVELAELEKNEREAKASRTPISAMAQRGIDRRRARLMARLDEIKKLQ